MNFLDNLKNVDWFYLTASGLACAKILAISHWGPWTWKLGRQMSRYWAYWTGILAVLWGWGLWSYWYGSGLNWLALLIANLLFHWPLWVFADTFMYRFSRAVSYGFASLPILAAYSIWSVAMGDYLSPLLLFMIYAIGGLCTLGYYRFDDWIKNSWGK